MRLPLLLPLVLLALLSGMPLTPAAQAATLTLACDSIGVRFAFCEKAAQEWSEKTGHTVKVNPTPTDATNKLAFYQQILSAGGPDIDIYQIDVIWPGILGQHFVDLNAYLTPAEKAEFFPVIIENNTIDGRLVAMPWFMEAGLLYYRKDLLEKYGHAVPKTWAEMAKVAQDIQDKERAAGAENFWGYVFQGRAYEGLTCNALEWVASLEGGEIVNDLGQVTINNDRAAKALQMAASWVDTISPPSVLNYTEEDARGAFQSGKAVFMRNWPYAYPLANKPGSEVYGKVGFAPLPAATADQAPGRSVLGGHHLAVSKYSEHPDLAIDLVRYMTRTAAQKELALEAGDSPTLMTLYDDAELLEKNPLLPTLYRAYQSAVSRPSDVTRLRYNQMSYEFWNAVHQVLQGRVAADDSLAQLATTLQRVSRHERW